MSRYRTMEIMVGLFMLLGVLALLVLALKASGLTNYWNHNGYYVRAAFDNVGGLKPRSAVSVAGVKIGRVTSINLNPSTFQADVTLYIDNRIRDIPKDSQAQILTEGLLGSNYISITPGFQNAYLINGDRIAETHPALILEDLIGQLLFKVNGDQKTAAKGTKPENVAQKTENVSQISSPLFGENSIF
jgi:phospholipid/cholesterol/gamma-HCH transport system substrate-binding protein